jgi:hypothetical protein
MPAFWFRCSRCIRWIAQAELSTFSRAPRLLPRSIYLSHQFTFYTLGEDYHALIRRFRLDVAGSKITVRREVEISAYPEAGADDDAFAGTSPRDIAMARRLSNTSGAAASFDEPLASALTGGLAGPGQGGVRVLPMLPNGARGARGVPIRGVAASLGGGAREGFGRLRRGVDRLRSPHHGPTTAPSASEHGAGVPLEFDEEDEDFLPRTDDASHGDVPPAVPDLSTLPPPVVLPPHREVHKELLPDEVAGEEDAWSGWDAQDRAAIDDAEQFNDLVVGIMDEEQIRDAVPPPSTAMKGKSKKKAKK